jgi:hypothetical protein
MKKTIGRKLTLRTETLRILNPAHLRAVHGGTVLLEAPPTTAPTTDGSDGGPARQTAYTCTCIG